MSTRFFLALFALLLTACGSNNDVPDASATPATQAPATTTTTAAPATTVAAETSTVPDNVALADPVEATDPNIVDLDDDVTIDTTVHSLVMDAGTEWELPLHIAVPTGWTWDAANTSFTDGTSRLHLSTGCSPDCLATAWDVTIVQPGGYLHDPMAGLPGGGFDGFGASMDNNEAHTTLDRVFEDGSGRSSTARYHHSGARWLGCMADVPAGAANNVETLSELCQAIVADWSTVVANTAQPTITETASDSIAALIAAPSIGQPPQIVALDEDDSTHKVSIELPADATVRVDGFFGTEVFLGDGYSIFTDVTLNAACDGLCAAQDWEAKINASDGEIGRTRAAIVPDADTSIESGWLISGPNLDGSEHHAVVVRWDDDSDQYFSCSIEADRDDADRIDDLLAICLTAKPLWFD